MKYIIAALVATATATTDKTALGDRETGKSCYWTADSDKKCKLATDCCAIITSSDHTKEVDGDGTTLKYPTPADAAKKATEEYEEYVEDAGKSKGECYPKAQTSWTQDDKRVLNYLCYTPENLTKAKWLNKNCEKETNEALKTECETAQSAAKTIAATFMTVAVLAAMM